MQPGGRRLVYIALGIICVGIAASGLYFSARSPTAITIIGVLTTSTPGPGQNSTGWILSTSEGPIEIDVSAVRPAATALQLKTATATGAYGSVNGRRVFVALTLK